MAHRFHQENENPEKKRGEEIETGVTSEASLRAVAVD